MCTCRVGYSHFSCCNLHLSAANCASAGFVHVRPACACGVLLYGQLQAAMAIFWPRNCCPPCLHCRAPTHPAHTRATSPPPHHPSFARCPHPLPLCALPAGQARCGPSLCLSLRCSLCCSLRCPRYPGRCTPCCCPTGRGASCCVRLLCLGLFASCAIPPAWRLSLT